MQRFLFGKTQLKVYHLSGRVEEWRVILTERMIAALSYNKKGRANVSSNDSKRTVAPTATGGRAMVRRHRERSDHNHTHTILYTHILSSEKSFNPSANPSFSLILMGKLAEGFCLQTLQEGSAVTDQPFSHDQAGRVQTVSSQGLA